VKSRLAGVLIGGMIAMSAIISPIASGQEIFPSIVLECIEAEVDFDLPDSDIATVHCSVENPHSYSEKVELSYGSAEIAVTGPGSITVAGEQTESFEVSLRAVQSTFAGTHEVNVTAQVTEAGGIPVGIITNLEEEIVSAIVPEWISCDVNYGIGSLSVEAGQEVGFTASYSCDSNKNQSLDVELHLVPEGAAQESMWPSGFNEISSQGCEIAISGGDGVVNCQFLLTTPSNLEEEWRGCLVVVDERMVTAKSCNDEDSLPLVVSSKEGGIEIGLGGNGSLLEDLSLSEDSLPYVAGIASISVVLVVLAIKMRRGVD